MLTSPNHPDALVPVSDLEAGFDLPAWMQPYEGPLRQIGRWAEEYLCQPHPELGREGPVCPYARSSIRKRLFFLTVRPGADLEPEDVEAHIKGLRDRFLEIEPKTGNDSIFKTILCLFPDVALEDTPRLIDAIQEKLRPEYVRHGLMVGEFHSRPPEKAGLWNDEFRPLNSPVPMLVIRHMVPTDIAFLAEERNLVAGYLERFGGDIPAHLRDQVQKAARRFGLSLKEEQVIPHVHPRVREALGEHLGAVTVHRHADLPGRIESPGDFAAALELPIDRVTKSLFFRCRGGEGRYGVAVCSVNRKIDLGRLAEAMGCTRLEMATREELSAQLGFSPGGVSPIGAGDIPVFLDRGLMEHPTVTVAAGEVAVEIEIAPDLLRRITDATVLSVTTDPARARS
jgi:prolyl-tRNA editing enzyme YbaK/EbsC (Cys-tRNA(Pro) deacylase)